MFRSRLHADANNSDSRAGGFERFVHVGDVVLASDAAVTAAPTNFV